MLTDQEYIELGRQTEEHTQGLASAEIPPVLIMDVVQVLARVLCEANAKDVKFNLKGFSVKGKQYGDVKLKITRS